MDKSESINELATALSKAQSCIEDATKSTEAYNYKYADLSQILRLVRPVFAENGLSLTQFPCDGGSSVSVESMLMHSSGQWLSQKFSMDVEASKGMSKAQAAGVVITYMRRYALAAIAGITQEDNDAAVQRKQEQKASEPKISQEQIAIIYPWVTEGEEGGPVGWSKRGLNFLQVYNISGVGELPASKFAEAVLHLGIK